jgi:hypothetical protein
VHASVHNGAYYMTVKMLGTARTRAEAEAALKVIRNALPRRASSTYVSKRFVDRVKAADLRGLAFNKVWSG